MTQKSSRCITQWNLKLVVQDTGDSTKQYHPATYRQMVKSLLTIAGINIDLVTSSEAITEALLNTETVIVSFDRQSKKLLSLFNSIENIISIAFVALRV